MTDVILQFRGELQKAEGVGDEGAAFADLDGGLLLGELKLSNELLVTAGFFDCVEIFALKIFYEGKFQNGAVIRFTDDDRDFRQPGHLGGAPPAFTGDQFKNVAALADDERLDDSLLLDGVRQFLKRFRGKILAWLKGTRANSCH